MERRMISLASAYNSMLMKRTRGEALARVEVEVGLALDFDGREGTANVGAAFGGEWCQRWEYSVRSKTYHGRDGQRCVWS